MPALRSHDGTYRCRVLQGLPARRGSHGRNHQHPSLDQNLASGSPEMRAYTVKVFERLIGISETIGARGVIVVTGRVNPLIQPSRENLEGWFEETFVRVLRIAERSGVKLLLENIPMGVYPRADQLIAFAQHIGSAQVEICYDIANAHFTGEDAVAGLKEVAPRSASCISRTRGAKLGGTIRRGRGVATSRASAPNCGPSVTRKPRCWRSYRRSR